MGPYLQTKRSDSQLKINGNFDNTTATIIIYSIFLTPLQSECPKRYRVLAIMGIIGLMCMGAPLYFFTFFSMGGNFCDASQGDENLS